MILPAMTRFEQHCLMFLQSFLATDPDEVNEDFYRAALNLVRTAQEVSAKRMEYNVTSELDLFH